MPKAIDHDERRREARGAVKRIILGERRETVIFARLKG